MEHMDDMGVSRSEHHQNMIDEYFDTMDKYGIMLMSKYDRTGIDAYRKALPGNVLGKQSEFVRSE